MPAGSPPGGLDRRFLAGSKLMNNFGLDAAVNFQVTARDNINGNIMIGGDNDYVGLLSDGIFSDPIQGAALPPSGNTFQRGAHNFTDRGWLVLDNLNALFLLNAGLTLSTTITPPAVVTRGGVVEYNGRILTGTFLSAGPFRNLEFSDDNGVTWDSDPGIFTGEFIGVNGIFTNFDQNLLLAAYSGGVSFSTTTDPAGETGWTARDAGNAAVPMNAASISDDGLRFCVVSQNGGVATHAGVVDPSNNPFQRTSAIGTSLDICQWVEALNGFFVMSTIGPNLGFVDAATPDRVIPGSYTGVAIAFADQCSISDGELMMVPTDANNSIISWRDAGQTGINL